jgi:hypothetical protein
LIFYQKSVVTASSDRAYPQLPYRNLALLLRKALVLGLLVRRALGFLGYLLGDLLPLLLGLLLPLSTGVGPG